LKGEIKAWAPGAVILWWLFLNPIRQHILKRFYDRHFLRRNDTNLNTWQ
jgi:hypothetical protein